MFDTILLHNLYQKTENNMSNDAPLRARELFENSGFR
jgi:hypothetical protein